MGNITIRKLSSDVLLKLSELAAAKNMSREAYLRVIINDIATAEQVGAVEDKYGNLVQLMSDQMQLTQEVIEHNNYMLEKIISKLN